MKCEKCGRREVEDPKKLTICERCNKHAFRKNYAVKCCNCEQIPTVGDTDLCGPCCFGEAATAGGNW